MKKTVRTRLIAVIGTGAVLTLATAHAANPFAARVLPHGYAVAAMDADAHVKAKDAKCGAQKPDTAPKEKTKEGKCGEGKCGNVK